MNTPYPDFLEKHLAEKDITTLKERESLHTPQFNNITFVRLSQEYKCYPQVSLRRGYRAKFYRIYIKGARELRHRLMGKGFFD